MNKPFPRKALPKAKLPKCDYCPKESVASYSGQHMCNYHLRYRYGGWLEGVKQLKNK